MTAGPTPFEPWRVRVRSAAEPARILGMGVLLDREHVLTCAHVAMADEKLVVDMIGLDELSTSPARIADGLCVPALGGDQRGDVAVLTLSVPQPDGMGATLRRAALTWDRHVHSFGYPRDSGLDETGVWIKMTLAGRAGVEWLQMNRRPGEDQRVRAGFSGAGVADDNTHDVLGIVVREYTDETAGLSWMLPVEVIIAHLPLVSEWVVGDSGIDPIFAEPVPAAGRAGQASRVGHLTDWLARRADGAAVLIVLGPDLDALRQAVALSSPSTANLSTVGRVVDLALDVGGLTVEQVCGRIVNRAGLEVPGASTPTARLRAGTPPMTIVVDGVDEAEQPAALLDDVFTPLVDSGTRLVLGFRNDDSASLAMARTLAARTVTGRLDTFAARIKVLADAGQQVDRVAQLRLGLSALRRAAAQDSALVASRLAKFGRAIASAEQDIEEAAASAGAVSADRGLLEATKAKAGDGGLEEHKGLAELYEAAVKLLTTDPVDAAAFHEAVRAYQEAVRRELAEGGQS